MNTHEANELQPNTLVRWLPPQGMREDPYEGAARREGPENIRVVWNDLAEPDTVIRITDRRMLTAIEICVPKTENDL